MTSRTSISIAAKALSKDVVYDLTRAAIEIPLRPTCISISDMLTLLVTVLVVTMLATESF
jgi:hypothetical protein